MVQSSSTHDLDAARVTSPRRASLSPGPLQLCRGLPSTSPRAQLRWEGPAGQAAFLKGVWVVRAGPGSLSALSPGRVGL